MPEMETAVHAKRDVALARRTGGQVAPLAWRSVHARLDLRRAAKSEVQTRLIRGARRWLQYEAADAVN